LFLAEVYGEFEWRLQQLGFDFTYDHTLYEQLAHQDAIGTRQHLSADWQFTRRLARFTENHDWTRAAERFGLNNRAASLLSFVVPGLRIVHDGQIEGRRKQSPVYIVRRPDEPVDDELMAFFERLFSMLNDPAIVEGGSRVLDLSSQTVIGIERCCPESRPVLCLVNLSATDTEIAFSTEAFAGIRDFHDLQIVSTELQRTPQLDLWSGGVTVRLRGHEGLLLSPAA
jgi:glycosidase